jgi:hypothetical protein
MIKSISRCIADLIANDEIRSGVLGIIVVLPVFGFMIWKSYSKELAIINHSKIVTAELIEVGTYDGNPRTGDSGGAFGKYRYTMLDGKEGAISISEDSLDEIPGYSNNEIIEVEYLPENPKFRRIKGSGNQNITDIKFWTTIKFLFLMLFVLMCIYMIIFGIRNRL